MCHLITPPEDPRHSALLAGVRAKIDRAQNHFLNLHERIKSVMGEAIDGQRTALPSEYGIEGDYREFLTVMGW